MTIATGKQLYGDMAAALARSFHYWNDEIPFLLFTDLKTPIPNDLLELEGIRVVRRPLQEIARGFSIKLFLDQLSPAEETLFIDADCLITGPIESVFDRFDDWSVTTVGECCNDGEWFGDIRARCEHFGVSSVPVFVGAVYYFKDDETTRRVFQTARSLVDRYDELGYVRLRNLPNEEPLISTGMALESQQPIEDDGSIKADAMNFTESIQVDVFEGYSEFRGNGSKKTSWGIETARPVIAHFNDAFAEKPPYTREQEKLRRVYADAWQPREAAAYAWMTKELPFRFISKLKDLGRPVYRSLFGTRKVKKNPRVLD